MHCQFSVSCILVQSRKIGQQLGHIGMELDLDIHVPQRVFLSDFARHIHAPHNIKSLDSHDPITFFLAPQ